MATRSPTPARPRETGISTHGASAAMNLSILPAALRMTTPSLLFRPMDGRLPSGPPATAAESLLCALTGLGCGISAATVTTRHGHRTERRLLTPRKALRGPKTAPQA